MNMTEGESAWLISAFQLTFASFLLMSGKISDLYSPKGAFVVGLAGEGLISLGAGFSKDKITIIVLRALTGIAASMTIPSALTLLVNTFPETQEQARAIGIFGGCGAVANVLGLVIGGVFVQYASWHWVFWFVALVATPVSLACIFLLPSDTHVLPMSQSTKLKKLDLPGVSTLTIALILFIFALTSGSTGQWASAMVLAPLVISLLMIGGFLYWETLLPRDQAAVPPQTWFLPNFAVLFGVALLPYLWWTTVFTIFTTLWQSVYQWRVIDSAVHFVPIGVISFAMSWTGPLNRKIDSKYLILIGHGFLVVATVLLAFADRPERYWSFVFPAFLLGSGGAMLTYTHVNIAIFRTTPSSMAGTVGAIFNGALQLGSAVGIAAVTSIETSVEGKEGGFTAYFGRRAAFWFLLGIVCVEAVAISVFYRPGVKACEEETATVVQEKDAAYAKGADYVKDPEAFPSARTSDEKVADAPVAHAEPQPKTNDARYGLDIDHQPSAASSNEYIYENHDTQEAVHELPRLDKGYATEQV
ncbi:MFS general substrate transporter [Gloeophyllum trabeum ATCC 11539]|uniref:MFS general substrate transporter n=1 Tax=Gloeophyllum trabeum (strain ATCC 11539 / FP-39264 / Madison 617) TaxID=670483 RepID=S7RKN2_GLOTA|nr:MFS general substrate transporter [Gloeophyllum trabeum ATCC 11539]EPQ53229.1 MFS general substrate transporter [Gloeophyllum trabeum ATCC 11539]